MRLVAESHPMAQEASRRQLAEQQKQPTTAEAAVHTLGRQQEVRPHPDPAPGPCPATVMPRSGPVPVVLLALEAAARRAARASTVQPAVVGHQASTEKESKDNVASPVAAEDADEGTSEARFQPPPLPASSAFVMGGDEPRALLMELRRRLAQCLARLEQGEARKGVTS